MLLVGIYPVWLEQINFIIIIFSCIAIGMYWSLEHVKKIQQEPLEGLPLSLTGILVHLENSMHKVFFKTRLSWWSFNILIGVNWKVYCFFVFKFQFIRRPRISRTGRCLVCRSSSCWKRYIWRWNTCSAFKARFKSVHKKVELYLEYSSNFCISLW